MIYSAARPYRMCAEQARTAELYLPSFGQALYRINREESEMSSKVDQATSRRKFLQFLAASSALSYADAHALAETLVPKAKLPDPLMWAPLDANNLIKGPKEAINVFDFEPVMRQNVPPAHFGYMASGIDDEVTLRANREGFLKFQLRPRRLVD